MAKTEFAMNAPVRLGQVNNQMTAKPSITMTMPKNRICPSWSLIICSNKLFQSRGKSMGIMPSSTSIKPKAKSSDANKKYHFLAGALAGVPRMPLKNSELPGSSTITSLLLLKLDL
jgi:hypothetical protein